MKTILYFFILFFSLILSSQNTVGTISITNEALDGYTLFTIHNKTFLINNCGQVIREWTSNFPPGNSVYLLEDGKLLRAGKSDANESINFPGTGGVIEIYSWEGNLEWQYFYESDTYKQHHDVYPLPNGNILILAATEISSSEAIAMGRDPSKLNENRLFNEQIVEVQPLDSDQASIVWEWNIRDHLIQDFDDTKINFGVVSDHIEKLDINFLNGGSGGANWLHVNSIQYDEILDQIVISSRNLSEIWIIDHSTTTAEASSSSGGIYGRGGDFLFRWGNQQAYKRGSDSDRRLYGQHYPHLIKQGLNNAGEMLVFNNGNGRTPNFSEVFMFKLPQSQEGFYTLNSDNTFDPNVPDYIYDGDSVAGTEFYSAIVSSAQRLSNGNILICEGRSGEIFEINENDEIVWEYIVPVSNTDGSITNQGEIVGNDNLTFRAVKYDLTFSGFDDKDLTPMDPIEGNWNLDVCESLSNSQYIVSNFSVYPNPVSDFLSLKNIKTTLKNINIYTTDGKLVFTNSSSQETIDVRKLSSGIYLIKLLTEDGVFIKRFLKN